jgi:glycosyltransferase involved in cell wall biosynthesis
MKVGIVTDFPSIVVQSGPALHTRFLHDGLTRRGHDVVLLGPDTGVNSSSGEARTHLLKGYAFPSHPQVKVVVPAPLRQLVDVPRLDVIHGQTNNHIIEWSNWMRKMHRTAVLNTNIIHLPTHSHFVLSDGLYDNPLVREAARQSANSVEREFARMYNDGDCLIVQSRFMVDYWRERGVRVPIEVVGRPIDPSKFSRQATHDPFPQHFDAGHRLVCVCRHDREKNLEKLIEIFDEHIAPANPRATLTLIGDGHAHDNYLRQASRATHGNRIHFPGEVSHGDLVNWYAYADLFVYTSLSETFGNVVNEALWCGLPVVALDDQMGVAHQVVDGFNGLLIPANRMDSDARFARAVCGVLGNRERKREMGQNAATHARAMSHPDVVLSRFDAIYDRAIQHAHDAIPVPLAQQSLVRQRWELARGVARWARYNYTLLALGNASFRLGLGRKVMDSAIPVASAPVATNISTVSGTPGNWNHARLDAAE